MALEDELLAAIKMRNEMAVGLATALLQLTTDYGLGPLWLSDHGIVGGRFPEMMRDIEALTAVILQRSGVPWDVMAARRDMTRQALHRRLSRRGEELFDYANGRGKRAEEFQRVQAEVEQRLSELEADGKLSRDPGQSQQEDSDAVFEYLESFPSEDEILTAPARLAEDLMSLREIPRWWDREWF